MGSAGSFGHRAEALADKVGNCLAGRPRPKDGSDARFFELYHIVVGDDAADPAQHTRSAYILAFQSPGFEEQIIADDCAYLEALWKAWSPGWDIPAELLADMKAAFRKPGVARAALEYYRQAFDAVSPAAQETAALFSRPIGVPTLGICGAEDQCITEDVFLGAMRESDFPGGLETRSIAGAGHFCHAEAPDTVNAALLDWFARHPA